MQLGKDQALVDNRRVLYLSVYKFWDYFAVCCEENKAAASHTT